MPAGNIDDGFCPGCDKPWESEPVDGCAFPYHAKTYQERSRSTGERYSCGMVAGPGDEPEVEVFCDQRCLVCGHVPCPCCGAWCDVLGQLTQKVVEGKVYEVVEDVDELAAQSSRPVSDDSSGMCCDGSCAYAAPPVFTLVDGTPWP